VAIKGRLVAEREVLDVAEVEERFGIPSTTPWLPYSRRRSKRCALAGA
jgi:hypothetical protein